MLYGDLGRVPLSIGIKKRAVGFWYDMILSKTYMYCVRACVRALACVCACARMYLCVCVFVYSICINYYIIYVVSIQPGIHKLCKLYYLPHIICTYRCIEKLTIRNVLCQRVLNKTVPV